MSAREDFGLVTAPERYHAAVAHCRPELLADLAPVLDAIRGWDFIKEPTPCVFYIRSTPFLHFHIKGERRWADVRQGAAWGTQLDVAAGCSAKERRAFLAAVESRYVETVMAKVKRPTAPSGPRTPSDTAARPRRAPGGRRSSGR